MADQIVIRKTVVRRTLVVIGVVAAIALTCVLCVMAMLYFDRRPVPIREIKAQGKTFVLTCAGSWDGATFLTLYECRDKFDKSCVTVGDYATVSLNCGDELTLREDGGTIEVLETYHAGYRRPDGTWVDQTTKKPLIVYSPH